MPDAHAEWVCILLSKKGGNYDNRANVLQPVPLDIRRGAKGARLGPAARLGPQPLGVRLTNRYVHRGIDDEILAKGRKSP